MKYSLITSNICRTGTEGRIWVSSLFFPFFSFFFFFFFLYLSPFYHLSFSQHPLNPKLTDPYDSALICGLSRLRSPVLSTCEQQYATTILTNATAILSTIPTMAATTIPTTPAATATTPSTTTAATPAAATTSSQSRRS